MKGPDRSNVASSFTLIKGAMIDETYAVFAEWDFGSSKKENLERLRSENFIGVRTAARLRDFIFVLNRRFDPSERDRALVLLAKSGCPIEEWKPILLWHMTRDEFLFRDFLVNWLFPAFTSGCLPCSARRSLCTYPECCAQGRKDRTRVERDDAESRCRGFAQDVSRFWTSARQCSQRICWIPSPRA